MKDVHEILKKMEKRIETLEKELDRVRFSNSDPVREVTTRLVVLDKLQRNVPEKITLGYPNLPMDKCSFFNNAIVMLDKKEVLIKIDGVYRDKNGVAILSMTFGELNNDQVEIVVTNISEREVNVTLFFDLQPWQELVKILMENLSSKIDINLNRIDSILYKDLLTKKEERLAPKTHNHIKNDVTDFAHNHVKNDVTDFAHNHIKNDVTDFAHNHVKNDVTDFAHNHIKNDVTDFAHNHIKNDVTDFAHNHIKNDVTDFAHNHDENYYTKLDSDIRYLISIDYKTVSHNVPEGFYLNKIGYIATTSSSSKLKLTFANLSGQTDVNDIILINARI